MPFSIKRLSALLSIARTKDDNLLDTVYNRERQEICFKGGGAGSPRVSRVTLSLLALLVVWSYLPVFYLYARQHWETANLQGAYAHAPLILMVLIYFAWRQREVFDSPPMEQISFKGLLLLAAGAATKLYGDMHGYVVLQGLSLIPLLAGILWVLQGEQAWRGMRFPLLMLLFVVPLPNAAIDAITQPLINLTSDLVVPLLSLFDIEVSRTGHLLTVNARGTSEFHEVLIAPECSGIRSLVSLLAISSMLAYLRGHHARRAGLLFLITPLLTVLGNVVRIITTIVLIVYVSRESAESFFHSASGIVLFVFALCGLFAADLFIDRLTRGRKSA
jgi:exosortase